MLPTNFQLVRAERRLKLSFFAPTDPRFTQVQILAHATHNEGSRGLDQSCGFHFCLRGPAPADHLTRTVNPHVRRRPAQLPIHDSRHFACDQGSRSQVLLRRVFGESLSDSFAPRSGLNIECWDSAWRSMKSTRCTGLDVVPAVPLL